MLFRYFRIHGNLTWFHVLQWSHHMRRIHQHNGQQSWSIPQLNKLKIMLLICFHSNLFFVFAFLQMIDPPQKYELSMNIPTCHGNWWGAAFCPPTILLLSFAPGTPQVAILRKTFFDIIQWQIIVQIYFVWESGEELVQSSLPLE